jgi:uncharacterized iron-regulated membrane protein
MQRLARWHIWLGWIVGLPMLMWTVTGLFMVLRPIEEVRGTDLRSQRLALPADKAFVVPQAGSAPVATMTLLQRIDGPVWIVERSDHSVMAASAVTGLPLPGLDARLARQIADGALKAPPRQAAIRRFAAEANPIDLRQGRPAWQIRYDDGTNVYVDADSGEVLAVRTRWWRAFDVMWGLHILDPKGREDSSHPLLIAMAGLSVLGALFGCILLFRRRRALRR